MVIELKDDSFSMKGDKEMTPVNEEGRKEIFRESDLFHLRTGQHLIDCENGNLNIGLNKNQLNMYLNHLKNEKGNLLDTNSFPWKQNKTGIENNDERRNSILNENEMLLKSANHTFDPNALYVLNNKILEHTVSGNINSSTTTTIANSPSATSTTTNNNNSSSNSHNNNSSGKNGNYNNYMHVDSSTKLVNMTNGLNLGIGLNAGGSKLVPCTDIRNVLNTNGDAQVRSFSNYNRRNVSPLRITKNQELNLNSFREEGNKNNTPPLVDRVSFDVIRNESMNLINSLNKSDTTSPEYVGNSSLLTNPRIVGMNTVHTNFSLDAPPIPTNTTNAATTNTTVNANNSINGNNLNLHTKNFAMQNTGKMFKNTGNMLSNEDILNHFSNYCAQIKERKLYAASLAQHFGNELVENKQESFISSNNAQSNMECTMNEEQVSQSAKDVNEKPLKRKYQTKRKKKATGDQNELNCSGTFQMQRGRQLMNQEIESNEFGGDAPSSLMRSSVSSSNQLSSSLMGNEGAGGETGAAPVQKRRGRVGRKCKASKVEKNKNKNNTEELNGGSVYKENSDNERNAHMNEYNMDHTNMSNDTNFGTDCNGNEAEGIFTTKRPQRVAAKKCINLWSEEFKKKSEKGQIDKWKQTDETSLKKEERAMVKKREKKDLKMERDDRNNEMKGVEHNRNATIEKNEELISKEIQEYMYRMKNNEYTNNVNMNHQNSDTQLINYGAFTTNSGPMANSYSKNNPSQRNINSCDGSSKGSSNEVNELEKKNMENKSQSDCNASFSVFNGLKDEREMFRYLDTLRHMPNKITGEQYKRQKELMADEMVKRSRQFPMVQGVYFDKYQQRWSVNWNEDGKRVAKYFPIKLFGFDYAWQLAVYCKNHQRIPEEAMLFEKSQRERILKEKKGESANGNGGKTRKSGRRGTKRKNSATENQNNVGNDYENNEKIRDKENEINKNIAECKLEEMQQNQSNGFYKKACNIKIKDDCEEDNTMTQGSLTTFDKYNRMDSISASCGNNAIAHSMKTPVVHKGMDGVSPYELGRASSASQSIVSNTTVIQGGGFLDSSGDPSKEGLLHQVELGEKTNAEAEESVGGHAWSELRDDSNSGRIQKQHLMTRLFEPNSIQNNQTRESEIAMQNNRFFETLERRIMNSGICDKEDESNERNNNAKPQLENNTLFSETVNSLHLNRNIESTENAEMMDYRKNQTKSNESPNGSLTNKKNEKGSLVLCSTGTYSFHSTISGVSSASSSYNQSSILEMKNAQETNEVAANTPFSEKGIITNKEINENIEKISDKEEQLHEALTGIFEEGRDIITMKNLKKDGTNQITHEELPNIEEERKETITNSDKDDTSAMQNFLRMEDTNSNMNYTQPMSSNSNSCVSGTTKSERIQKKQIHNMNELEGKGRKNNELEKIQGNNNNKTWGVEVEVENLENQDDDSKSRIVGVHYDRKQFRWKATWYTSHGRRCAKYYPIKQYGYDQAKKMAIECRKAYNFYKKFRKGRKDKDGNEVYNIVNNDDDENNSEIDFQATLFTKEYYINLFETDEKKYGYDWDKKKNKNSTETKDLGKKQSNNANNTNNINMGNHRANRFPASVKSNDLSKEFSDKGNIDSFIYQGEQIFNNKEYTASCLKRQSSQQKNDPTFKEEDNAKCANCCHSSECSYAVCSKKRNELFDHICNMKQSASLLSLYSLSVNILKFQKDTIKCVLQDLRDNCLYNLAFELENETFQDYYMAIHFLSKYVEESNSYDDIFKLLKPLAKNLEIRKIPSLYDYEEQINILNKITAIYREIKNSTTYFSESLSGLPNGTVSENEDTYSISYHI